jgi:methylmalonyl-CoA mutase N-terminal domain/subunit
MDEALGLPTESAVRTALRTQQALAYEHGAGDVIDALGGSFAIERLTNDLEDEATALLEQIDDLGGMVAAIERGWVQRKIEDAAYDTQKRIEGDEQVVVGVNRFTEDDDGAAEVEVHEIPPGLEERKAEALAALRARRDAGEVDRALDALADAARGDGNIVEQILAAVDVDATLGEVADRLREVFGEYRDPNVVG